MMPVYPILLADSAVNALVAGRIYPAGIMPQEVTARPVIVYQTIAGTPLNTLADATRGDNERIQIDAWDVTLAGAQAVMAAVRAALDSIATLQAHSIACECSSINGHDYDTETKTYRDSADFSFWSA